MQPQNNNLENRVSKLENDVDQLKKDVQEIKITARILGTFLGIASVAGVFNLIRNANQTVSETVNKAIEDQVPTMVQGELKLKFPDIEQMTEKFNKAVVESDNILQIAEEIKSSQPLRDRISNIGKQYSQCEWVTVGYEKSHENIGGWCPEGSLVAQLDLDADENRPSGSSPIISQAYCCAP